MIHFSGVKYLENNYEVVQALVPVKGSCHGIWETKGELKALLSGRKTTSIKTYPPSG